MTKFKPECIARPSPEEIQRRERVEEVEIDAEEAFRQSRGLDSAIRDSGDNALDEDAEQSEEEIVRKEIRQAALEQMETFKRKFARPMVAWRALASDCLLFSNGFGYMIGCDNQQELADRHTVTKQAVSKQIKKNQRANNLPEVAGQRDAKGRLHMKESREKQLRK
jgi:hypothetical protein